MTNLSLRLLCACSLLFAFAAVAARADEQIDNPQYKQWSAFKPGTWVKFHQTVEAAGQKTEMDTTTKLIEISPDKAVLESTMSMTVAGNKMDMPAQKQEVPAKTAKPANTGDVKLSDVKADVKEGTEELTVGGKTFKCKTWESTSKTGNDTVWTKTWTSDEIPAGTVRMHAKSDGQAKSATTMELVGFEIAK
jgi:hypothetical protein